MPNPVKRHSKSRRDSRRAHDAIKAPAGAVCPQCNEPKMPHRACLNCGTYKGREVVNIDKGE